MWKSYLTITPCRSISKNKVIYTDHYTSLLNFKNLPLKNKEGGWDNYKASMSSTRTMSRASVYKLLYVMNKDTRISARTPVGDTEYRDTREGWGQGTIEGAVCSAVNLDNGIRYFFQFSDYEISYGDCLLSLQFFKMT